jgi:signal peptidase II
MVDSLHMRLFLVAAFSFSCSLLGRMLAEKFLLLPVPLVGSFLALTPVENAGVAFGFRLPMPLQSVLIAGVLLLFCAIAYRDRRNRIRSWGYGLIIGGAVGNIVDRLDDGVVTDFFHIGSFPVFNVADSFITVGAALLIAGEILPFVAKKRVSRGS